MPRIPPKSLNLVSYLYTSEEDAKAGTDFGGTAFFVSIAAEEPGKAFLYAITNWHVAVREGASVLRVNCSNGETDIFSYGPEQWQFDPKYDIAAVRVPLRSGFHAFSVMQAPSGFVMKDDVERAKIGPGEDVFMVGRFVDHDGGPINRPAVRFGNISVMPAPIEQPNGPMADCYCIDLHSRGGYSGSPVFMYRMPGYDLEARPPAELKDAVILMEGTHYLALLGIHFAQFPEEWEIANPPPAPKLGESRVPLIRGGQYVKGLSGMTCVLPAWTIWEVLNLPSLARDRAEVNEQFVARQILERGNLPKGE